MTGGKGVRTEDETLWRVISVVHGAKRAAAAQTALEAEGFLVRTRNVDRTLAAQDGVVELLVLESEAREAREFLSENGL